MKDWKLGHDSIGGIAKQLHELEQLRIDPLTRQMRQMQDLENLARQGAFIESSSAKFMSSFQDAIERYDPNATLLAAAGLKEYSTEKALLDAARSAYDVTPANAFLRDMEKMRALQQPIDAPLRELAATLERGVGLIDEASFGNIFEAPFARELENVQSAFTSSLRRWAERPVAIAEVQATIDALVDLAEDEEEPAFEEPEVEHPEVEEPEVEEPEVEEPVVADASAAPPPEARAALVEIAEQVATTDAQSFAEFAQTVLQRFDQLESKIDAANAKSDEIREHVRPTWRRMLRDQVVIAGLVGMAVNLATPTLAPQTSAGAASAPIEQKLPSSNIRVCRTGSGTLNLRSEPSIESEQVGSIENNDRVEELRTEKGWSYVQRNGPGDYAVRGWVATAYLVREDQVTPAAPVPRWTPASEPTCCGSGCDDCPF